MGYRLAELAELVGGRVEGDPDRAVDAIRSLEAAGPRDLSVLKSPRYREQAEASRAGVLLVGPALAGAVSGRDLLIVAAPDLALARLAAALHPAARREPGVHSTAVLEPGCEVDPTACVGPYAVIGAGSRIGAGATVHAAVSVGRDCVVGEGAVLHPHAVLYDGTRDRRRQRRPCRRRCWGPTASATPPRAASITRCRRWGGSCVEEEVEIGANSTVDRATLGETRIGAGTKIDNLVQVGHNVRVGRHCILCGQAGIAGSARLGDGVVLAGQAGVAGHIELGDGVQVAAKSAALASVGPGTAVAGIPAVELRKWRRQTALLSRLEEMSRRLRALEKRLGDAKDEGEEG